MTTDRNGRDINVKEGKQGFQERARDLASNLSSSGFDADDGGLIGNGPDGAEQFKYDGRTFSPMMSEQVDQETNINGIVVKSGTVGPNTVTETYGTDGVMVARIDSPAMFAQGHEDAVLAASKQDPNQSVTTPTPVQRAAMLGASKTLEGLLGAPVVTEEDDAVGEVYTTTINPGENDEVSVKSAVREFDGVEYNVSSVRMGQVTDPEHVEFSTMLRVDTQHLDQEMMRSLHNIMVSSNQL